MNIINGLIVLPEACTLVLPSLVGDKHLQMWHAVNVHTEMCTVGVRIHLHNNALGVTLTPWIPEQILATPISTNLQLPWQTQATPISANLQLAWQEGVGVVCVLEEGSKFLLPTGSLNSQDS